MTQVWWSRSGVKLKKKHFSLNISGPTSKRSLIIKPHSLITKPQTKQPSKSNKPIQSIHLLNAPDDLYYTATKKIKTIRQDVEVIQIKKLARTPFKTLNDYQNQYTTISKIWVDSIALFGEALKSTTKSAETNSIDLSTATTTPTPKSENGDDIHHNNNMEIPPPTTPRANGEVVVLD